MESPSFDCIYPLFHGIASPSANEAIPQALVLFSYGTVDAETLQDYARLFQYGIINTWTRPVEETKLFKPTLAGQPLRLPQIRITDSLIFPLAHRDGDILPIDYISVVCGSGGPDERFKVILSHTSLEASRKIFLEAANGYSVVFSGAILKSVSLRWAQKHHGDKRWVLKKVDSLGELLEMDAEAGEDENGEAEAQDGDGEDEIEDEDDDEDGGEDTFVIGVWC